MPSLIKNGQTCTCFVVPRCNELGNTGCQHYENNVFTVCDIIRLMKVNSRYEMATQNDKRLNPVSIIMYENKIDVGFKNACVEALGCFNNSHIIPGKERRVWLIGSSAFQDVWKWPPPPQLLIYCYHGEWHFIFHWYSMVRWQIVFLRSWVCTQCFRVTCPAFSFDWSLPSSSTTYTYLSLIKYDIITT